MASSELEKEIIEISYKPEKEINETTIEPEKEIRKTSCEPKKEINILLLGETGVGKSTFINAFANYLSYDTLEEAEINESICLIPTSFVVTDANYEQQNVQYGYSSEVKSQPDGQSDTKKCCSYCFKYGEVLIRMIDTPGVGDTRGILQDKMNFQHLLSFIAEYKELHLICILMKPDMQRLTNSFKYCLTQLLCHLQKDASENMVFIFTNARSTLYRPKNTLVLLKQLLKEIKERPPNVVIPIERNTMYCFDNDSFQFLIALHNGIAFAYDEKTDYAHSWSKSVNECMRLLDYISLGKDGLPLRPHIIQNTISVNETRRLIVALNKPLAEITKKLDENRKELEKLKKEIENFSGRIQDLIDMIDQNEYKHESSFWEFVPIVQIILYIYKISKLGNAKITQEFLIRKLLRESNNKQLKEDMLNQLQIMINDYDQERRIIVESCAKFAYFIKSNAIVSYNDYLKDYLFEQIDMSRKACFDETKYFEVARDLVKILNDYEEEKRILEENLANGTQNISEISAENINHQIKALYALKITGKEIETLHKESKNKQNVDLILEKVHLVKPNRFARIFTAWKSWWNIDVKKITY